jgi:hypothetical protein
MSPSHSIADLACHLAQHAEAVCRCYLPNGRRQGRYWLVGDVDNAPGRSLMSAFWGRIPERAPPANGPTPPRAAMAICSTSSGTISALPMSTRPRKKPVDSSACRNRLPSREATRRPHRPMTPNALRHDGYGP